MATSQKKFFQEKFFAPLFFKKAAEAPSAGRQASRGGNHRRAASAAGIKYEDGCYKQKSFHKLNNSSLKATAGCFFW